CDEALVMPGEPGPGVADLSQPEVGEGLVEKDRDRVVGAGRLGEGAPDALTRVPEEVRQASGGRPVLHRPNQVPVRVASADAGVGQDLVLATGDDLIGGRRLEVWIDRRGI